MIEEDKINVFMIFGSFFLLISTFLPWVRYIDVSNNYILDLNALNLLTHTFSMGFIPWESFLDTYGIDGLHIPMIFPLITGIIGIIVGILRYFQKFEFVEERKHYEILLWLCTFSFGSFIYILISIILFSNFLWPYDIIVYLYGSGVIFNLIGSIILFSCGIIIKKQSF
jgi:hypothetical protein